MVTKLRSRPGYTLYWATWLALLTLTVVMLVTDGSAIPRSALLAVLLLAMLLKATLIGANFMHLRFERLPLALMVIVGLLITGTVLFVLIAPDAARIHAMPPYR